MRHPYQRLLRSRDLNLSPQTGLMKRVPHMRILAASLAAAPMAVLLFSAGIAAEAQFRMQLPSVVIWGGDGPANPPDDGLPPDNGTSAPIEVYASDSAGREFAPISIPVVLAGATGAEVVSLDGPSGLTWTSTTPGNGTVSWSSATAGTYPITIKVDDAQGLTLATKAISLTVHGSLVATVPQTTYAAFVGDALTIEPEVQNLVSGAGTGLWSATPELPSWLPLDDATGRILVDTSSEHGPQAVVLTVVDQNDLATASTPSFTVSVTGPCGIWNVTPSTEQNNWNGVTYGNGKFVAVASTGTNRVMTSPDGVVWTPRSASEANAWRSVTYGNGLFVAVSPSGTSRVMTSPDGITWTSRSAPSNTWYSVAFGNGIFVAVSSDGSAMSSTNGVTWTTRTPPAGSSNWNSVAYGGNVFVAVALTGTNRVMTSPDGATWTARTSPLSTWNAVAFGSGKFVAIASAGAVMTSPDGVVWTSGTPATTPIWRAISYGNGKFVATSNVDEIMTSSDGIEWTARTVPESNNWFAIAHGNGTFVAVAASGTNRVMTSACH